MSACCSFLLLNVHCITRTKQEKKSCESSYYVKLTGACETGRLVSDEKKLIKKSIGEFVGKILVKTRAYVANSMLNSKKMFTVAELSFFFFKKVDFCIRKCLHGTQVSHSGTLPWWSLVKDLIFFLVCLLPFLSHLVISSKNLSILGALQKAPKCCPKAPVRVRDASGQKQPRR